MVPRGLNPLQAPWRRETDVVRLKLNASTYINSVPITIGYINSRRSLYFTAKPLKVVLPFLRKDVRESS